MKGSISTSLFHWRRIILQFCFRSQQDFVWIKIKTLLGYIGFCRAILSIWNRRLKISLTRTIKVFESFSIYDLTLTFSWLLVRYICWINLKNLKTFPAPNCAGRLQPGFMITQNILYKRTRVLLRNIFLIVKRGLK